MITLFLVIIAIVSYLLGGVNGAIIASKYIYRKDIRKFGSGNAGLTNFYRTFGPIGVALVLAIDIVKSLIAVLIGAGLMSFSGYPMVGKLFAGFCLILGHTYPVMYQLKGGKGVLCAVVTAFLVDWKIAMICVIAFGVTVIFTKFVSLGSLIGAAIFPIAVWCFGYGGLEGLIGLFCTVMIVFNHRANIVRLSSGREPRMNFRGGRKKTIADDDFIE